MMCRASACDAPVQFLKPLVKPGNVLLTNCGVSTADCIYPTPHQKPEALFWNLLEFIIITCTNIYIYNVILETCGTNDSHVSESTHDDMVCRSESVWPLS